MEIKIEDYLERSDIKEIVSDELRMQIRKHFGNEENAARLLSNLAYTIVSEEVNKIVPKYEGKLVNDVAKILNDESKLKYVILDYHYLTGEPKSIAAKIVDRTIRENEATIKSAVIKSIQERDYSEDTWNKFENLSESFMSNIYDLVEVLRGAKKL